jgi:lysophospholipase L1-like esterase
MSRAVRRLAVAVAALVAADRFEPALLRSLEEARYEDPARDFRFENSDLFGLGPLVTYLREHPRGRARRVLFFGNSITYGYLLGAADALPAHYQRLDTSAKVFNVGINGFETGSSFLIAKAIIDSVDLLYVLRQGEANAHPILPKLIPIENADLAQFHLAGPNETERMLSQVVNHWRLYRDAYRLQAALFGTSTREYIYLHKGALVRSLIARVRAAQPESASSDGTVTIDAPVSVAAPDAGRQARLRAQNPHLWQFGDLFVNRRKQVVFLHLPGYSEGLEDDAIADFNRVYVPYARVLVLQIPGPLTFDGAHLTSAGAAQVARALWNARPEDHAR